MKIRDPNPHSILKTGSSPELFARVAAQYPQYLDRPRKDRILFRRPVGHPDIDEFVSSCRSIGATIAEDRSQELADVRIVESVCWPPSEINLTPLLRGWVKGPEVLEARRELVGNESVWSVKINERLKKKSFRERQIGCIWAHGDYVLMRGELRDKFERSGLKGLKFVPLQTETGSWPDGVEPWWLLWSDVMLPPVKNKLFDNDGRVWLSHEHKGPFPMGCWPLDGYQGEPRLIYDSAILNLEAFDIAVTHERFGNREPCLRQPIFSQRFRAFCQAHKLRFGWFPVKII